MKSQDRISRRKFIGYSAAGLSAMALPWYLNCGKSGGFDSNLFFSKEDLPRIRENITLPLFKPYWDSIKNIDFKAKTDFLNNELNILNHVYHLRDAGQLLRNCAFISAVEEDKKYSDLARLVIEKLLSYNEWDYFLEGGTETIGLQRAPETTIYMCLAYDLLNETLTKAEKDDMIDGIAKKGIPACYLTLWGMKNPDKVKGWTYNEKTTFKLRADLSRWPYFLNYTNLKAIPIAGLSVGAAFMYDKVPEAEKWIELAQTSLRDFGGIYEKDGSYPEGIGYWSYATSHVAMGVDAIKRKLNIDLTDILNFQGTMKYCLNMQMPSNNFPEDVINFSDTKNKTDASVGFWIGREFNDGLAQHTAESLNERRSIYAICWYDKSIKPVPPGEDLLDVRMDSGRIISRTGWGEDDTVVALRSGGPVNHEHADRNSLILKAHGERLFNDPYHAPYDPKLKHWLLRLPEAHTAVLVDGMGHQYHDGSEGVNSSLAESKIVQYDVSGKLKIFTSDATHGYNLVDPDIKKVQRTVIFHKPDVLLLIDEFEKAARPSTFQARFQMFNEDNKAAFVLSNRNKTFRIIRPGVSVFSKVNSSQKLKITNDRHDVDKEVGIFPYIEVSSAKAKKCAILTACAIHKDGDEAPQISIKKKQAGWDVFVTTAKTSANIEVRMGGNVPGIDLVQ